MWVACLAEYRNQRIFHKIITIIMKFVLTVSWWLRWCDHLFVLCVSVLLTVMLGLMEQMWSSLAIMRKNRSYDKKWCDPATGGPGFIATIITVIKIHTIRSSSRGSKGCCFLLFLSFVRSASFPSGWLLDCFLLFLSFPIILAFWELKLSPISHHQVIQEQIISYFNRFNNRRSHLLLSFLSSSAPVTKLASLQSSSSSSGREGSTRPTVNGATLPWWPFLSSLSGWRSCESVRECRITVPKPNIIKGRDLTRKPDDKGKNQHGWRLRERKEEDQMAPNDGMNEFHPHQQGNNVHDVRQ